MSMGGGAEAMGGGASAMGGAEADLGAMTEEEQIAYAIQMSMAESAGPSDSSTPAAQPEPMEDGKINFFRKYLKLSFRLISTRN